MALFTESAIRLRAQVKVGKTGLKKAAQCDKDMTVDFRRVLTCVRRTDVCGEAKPQAGGEEGRAGR
jgi:hypothetical protein